MDDRLAAMNWAISEGDKAEAVGLFLGLAKHPEHRERLKDAILFPRVIDLHDTILNRGGYQNIGHKALRARALVDIADYLGWDDAHDLMCTVVPNLGCSPHLHGRWPEISNICRIELPDHPATPKRSDAPVTERGLDVLTETLLRVGPYEINAAIMHLFRRGAGILNVVDAGVVCFQRYLIDVLEQPNAFLVKAVFMGARFMNDTIRSDATVPRAVDRLLAVLER